MNPRTAAILLLATLMPLGVHANSDVVVFDNGDRLTGEIKSLARGKLNFKTDATDTISIEWDNVAFLSSEQNIQVETHQGRRYLGRLKLSPALRTISVDMDGVPLEIAANDVVTLTPIEEKGINRLDGDVTAGYNFSQASEVQQFQFGLDMQIRTETRIFDLSVDNSLSDSADNEASQRSAVVLDYKRLRSNRWFTGAMIGATRNDELGIDMRTSLGAGIGRILSRTNYNSTNIESGLMVSKENLASEESDQDTLEAYVGLNWDWFRYDSPELDLSTSLQVIPNLTDWGRVRAELDISVKWEMIDDLFWQISLYDSFDSSPAVEDAEKNDYGIVTSIGYSF